MPRVYLVQNEWREGSKGWRKEKGGREGGKGGTAE